jgi:putative nucleotidyltransferase with HDIG domain
MAMLLLNRRRSVIETPSPRPSPGRRLFENLDQVDELPHLSDTAVQAMTLANSPDSTLAEMVNVLRRDGMMTAAVLKLANSVVYRGGAEVSDVQQAVVRVGFRGCGQLVSGIGMRSIYNRHPADVQATCEQILRHSLFTATLASAVRRVLQLDLQGEEFTAALLHDIGRVVMCCKAPNEYAQAGVPEFDDADDVLALERDAFGSDHCAVGSLFAVKNNLPNRIARAILHHHQPAHEYDFRELVSLVALCDALANHIQLYHNLTGFTLDANVGFLALRTAVDEQRLNRLREQLPKVVVHCVKETRSMLKSMYS